LTILYYSPSNSVGGAELSLLQTMQYMNNNGVRIVLVMPPSLDDTYYLMAKKVVNSIYFVKGMNWISLNGNGIEKFKNWAYNAFKSGGWHIVPLLKLSKIIVHERVDLVHTNSSTCIDAALAAKITLRPHVQHIREITGTSKEALFRLNFQGTSFFRKLYSNLNNTILCNSYYTLRASEIEFPKEKLMVIYNTVQSPSVLPVAYDDGVMHVCIIANLTARMKNHILALQVAKYLKELGLESKFKFNFFGKLLPERDSYFSLLRSYIEENELDSMIEFKGLCKTSDILNSNQVLFHTFEGESFGRVYIEAMSYGRPIIAVKGEAAEELIEHGKEGYLVGKDDPQKIAQTLIALSKDSNQYLLMRENGIAKAKSFSEEVILPELLVTYRKIINKFY
jgi:glycosyltransferase involved in cell wall biosynthesis